MTQDKPEAARLALVQRRFAFLSAQRQLEREIATFHYSPELSQLVEMARHDYHDALSQLRRPGGRP